MTLRQNREKVMTEIELLAKISDQLDSLLSFLWVAAAFVLVYVIYRFLKFLF